VWRACVPVLDCLAARARARASCLLLLVRVLVRKLVRVLVHYAPRLVRSYRTDKDIVRYNFFINKKHSPFFFFYLL
jgi:hypothetical protein